MLSLEQIEDIVANISYKPNTRFDVTMRGEGVDISFRATLPNSVKGRRPIEFHIWRTLDPCFIWTKNNVVGLIGSMIREFELHEIDEWFKYKGKCVTNPHPELTN